MKRTLSVAIILALSFQVSAAQKTRIVPFKIWKQNKIDDAKSIVTELRRESKKLALAKVDDDEDEKESATRRLSQAELNLGVAKELSANDYFVLYVAPQFKDNFEALTAAAKTLTPRDVADILGAYQKRLQPVDVFGAKSNAGNPDPAAL